MPFFSIIIPSYNRAHLISETIISVQNQIFNDWECIIVDDGSTDNTKEVITEIAKKDPRIKYIYQNNAERSAARNNGIRNAVGQYICFLDSDDLYDNNYLLELKNFIYTNKVECGLVITNFLELHDYLIKETQTLKLNQANIGDWLFFNPASPSRVCGHQTVFKNHQFREDICIVEDTILWITIANYYPIFQLEKPLIYYRVHSENSVTSFSGSSFKRYEGLKIFFKDKLSFIVSSKCKKQMLSDVRFRIAEFYKQKNRNLSSAFYCIYSIFTLINHKQNKMKLFCLLDFVPGFKKLWSKIKTT